MARVGHFGQCGADKPCAGLTAGQLAVATGQLAVATAICHDSAVVSPNSLWQAARRRPEISLLDWICPAACGDFFVQFGLTDAKPWTGVPQRRTRRHNPELARRNPHLDGGVHEQCPPPKADNSDSLDVSLDFCMVDDVIGYVIPAPSKTKSGSGARVRGRPRRVRGYDVNLSRFVLRNPELMSPNPELTVVTLTCPVADRRNPELAAAPRTHRTKTRPPDTDHEALTPSAEQRPRGVPAFQPGIKGPDVGRLT